MNKLPAVDALRRYFLSAAGTSTALALACLITPLRTLAAEWARPAFTASNFGEALKVLGYSSSVESQEILFTAPEIAENGAQVVVEITSQLPGSQTISIFIEKNPMPLAATFNFANGALPQVRVPLKMAETSRIRAVVRTADAKCWHAQREVKVTTGGCGG